MVFGKCPAALRHGVVRMAFACGLSGAVNMRLNFLTTTYRLWPRCRTPARIGTVSSLARFLFTGRSMAYVCLLRAADKRKSARKKWQTAPERPTLGAWGLTALRSTSFESRPSFDDLNGGRQWKHALSRKRHPLMKVSTIGLLSCLVLCGLKCWLVARPGRRVLKIGVRIGAERHPADASPPSQFTSWGP